MMGDIDDMDGFVHGTSSGTTSLRYRYSHTGVQWVAFSPQAVICSGIVGVLWIRRVCATRAVDAVSPVTVAVAVPMAVCVCLRLLRLVLTRIPNTRRIIINNKAYVRFQGRSKYKLRSSCISGVGL